MGGTQTANRSRDRTQTAVPRRLRWNMAMYDAVKAAAAIRGISIEQFVHDTFCDALNRPDLRDKSPGVLLRNAG